MWGWDERADVSYDVTQPERIRTLLVTGLNTVFGGGLGFVEVIERGHDRIVYIKRFQRQ